MDKEVRDLILLEQVRQNEGIELIASENYASKEVREMMASILTNKYAEGYHFSHFLTSVVFTSN